MPTPQVGALAGDFSIGDIVVRFNDIYPGVVVGVHKSINCVDVQYQTGWEREDPEDLIPISLYSLALSVGPNTGPGFIPNLQKRSDFVRVAGRIKERIKLSRQAKLFELGFSLVSSKGEKRKKIALYIAKNYTFPEINQFILDYGKASLAMKISDKKTSSNEDSSFLEGALDVLDNHVQELQENAQVVQRALNFLKSDLVKKQEPKPRKKVVRTLDPSTLDTYAKRSFKLKNGVRIRIVFNPEVEVFQLLYGNKLVDESKFLSKLARKFNRYKRRDKKT